jgi:hypothetical protein
LASGTAPESQARIKTLENGCPTFYVIFMRWELIQPTFSAWRTYKNQSANARIESEILMMKIASYHAKALDKIGVRILLKRTTMIFTW